MPVTKIAGLAARCYFRFAALLCLLPFLLGLWGILRKSGGSTLLDFNAVVCAGDAWRRGASLYAAPVPCLFGPAMPYVYPPPLAAIMGWLQRGYGLSFELVAAGALCGVALAAVLRDLLAGARDAQAFRAPFYCALTARALFSGNVSLLFHAAIFLAAVHAGSDALLLGVIVACAIGKPTFVVYAALFLFLDRPRFVRWSFAAVGVAGPAAYLAGFYLIDGATFAEWIDVAKRMNLEHTGHSFLALSGGLPIPETARIALYAGLAILLLLAAAAARRRLALEERERVFFGLAICVLLNPRLMYYDHLTLPFGMGAVCAALASGGPRRRAAVFTALAAMWLAVTATAGVRGGEFLYAGCLAAIFAGALSPGQRCARSKKMLAAVDAPAHASHGGGDTSESPGTLP